MKNCLNNSKIHKKNAIKKLNIKKVGDLCEVLLNTIEKPQIELRSKNTYTLLVAVILSAQATDKGVNKATIELFEVADTPEKMLELGEEKLKQYIRTINYFNTKAKNIIRMSEQLVEHFYGAVPDNMKDLQSLAGVGRKSANVIMNCAYGEETIAVDTHVFRVSNRTGIVNAENVLDTEMQLMKRVPKKYRRVVHHLLVLHGRYVCKAVKPLCMTCGIKDICLYDAKKL